MAGFVYHPPQDSSRYNSHQTPHYNATGSPSVNQMAGTQQYNFPPPPPPPGPPPSQQHQQYGYAQQAPQYQQPQTQRGGAVPRGGARGGSQAPYNPHQPNGGYNPQQAQGPPAYGGPNGQQNSAPYIGPQAPTPQPPQQGPGYGGSQWQNGQQNQQHGPPHHGPPHQQQHSQPPVHHQPPASALPAQNYHPNYAPQAHQPPQPQQYGPQQPQPYNPQQPQPYGHSVPPHQPPYGGPPQQWTGPPQQARPPFNNNRGRGGFQNTRGGHEAPLMGPPIRMGFDNDRGGHMAQAGNGFTPHYTPHQTPPAAFSQPPYQGFPPHDYGQRPSLDPNPYNSGSPNRGRGNPNFRGRGRGDNQHSRGGRDNNRHQNGGQRSTSESFHKPAGADANGKKKKKRRMNTLGLTPNGAEHEDSEDEVDDVDEEARLVTLLGPDTPQLPTDLAAWIEERKSRFPTKARRETAAEELRQRREQGRNGRNKQDHKEKPAKKEDGETKLERQQRKVEKLRLELEKQERKIQEKMSGKRKRENGDEDEDRPQVSDEQSDGSSGSESDDSKPETTSSRHHQPMRVAQPPKAQLQRHCKYFSTGGTCGKKGKCRFVHDQEVRSQAMRDKEANGGKMTIAQRLILNDTAKDDLTILKSIKYLKEKGAMAGLTGDGTPSDDFKGEENGYAENLNYGDN